VARQGLALRPNIRARCAHVIALSSGGIDQLTTIVCRSHGQDPEGHSVLHAFVLAGQAQACRDLVSALPRSDAVALARRRNHANLLATELVGEVDKGVVTQVAQELTRALSPLLAIDDSAVLAPASGLMGRGGAVRRRKGSEASTQSAMAPMEVSEAHGSSDESKAAAAAGDLLQLAAAASSCAPPGRPRSSQVARPRDAKPYQRRPGRGAGRGGREDAAGAGDDNEDKDCWLPGGFWWRDHRMPMPSGRQPGELAGWAPLAGELTQQRDQEHRQALSHKEHFVQTLGSRDDAAAYLQQLGLPGAERLPRTAEVTRSVDDLDIEHATAFKQLASWGGFRRHFKEEEVKDESDIAAEAKQTASSAEIASSGVEVWKQQLREQLLAKRAEVMATQRKLESLSLEQQELEMLFKRTL